MRKILFVFVALLYLHCLQTKAQGYHKFLNNSSWCQSANPGFAQPINYYVYNQNIDTIINSVTYAKIVISGGSTTFFAREDTIAKKVYIKDNVNVPEVILYDFSLNVGDTLYAKHGWGAGYKLIVRTIDTVTTLVGQRRQFHLSDTSGVYGYSTIESIGSMEDPFLNFIPAGDPVYFLVCSYQNHIPVYNANLYGYTCYSYDTIPCNAAFTYTLEPNGQVTFTNLAPAYSYSWFGEVTNYFTVNTPSVTITFPCNGTYSVGCGASMNPPSEYNDFCIATQYNITITSLPDSLLPNFTYTLGCNGEINLTNTSINLTSDTSISYYWSISDITPPYTYGSGSGLTSPSFTFPVNTSVVVTLNIQGAQYSYCSNSNSFTDTIFLPPPPTLNLFLQKDTALANTWNAYPNYSAQVTNATWNWGDGTSTQGLYPSHMYSTTGTYSICVQVFDIKGCTTPQCQTLLVDSNMTYVNAMYISPTSINPLCLSPADTFAIALNPVSLCSADFNGDGFKDLATIGVNNNSNVSSISILFGNGSGNYGTVANFPFNSPIYGSYVICSTDINGDGKPDIAIANQSTDSVTIFVGNGLGSFSVSANAALGTLPVSIIAADFNGDNKIDLVTANRSSNDVTILIGDGNGGISSVTNDSIGTNSTPVSVISSDLNNDGKLDLAVGNANSANVSILLGSGTGTFSAPTNINLGVNVNSVCSADFNNDGFKDLAVASGYFNQVYVVFGNGTGAFSAPISFSISGNNPNSIISTDLNSDGKADLAVVNYGSASVSILIGNGEGNFLSESHFPILGDHPISIISNDFNNDGKTDLATVNYYSSNVSVLLGCNSTSAINQISNKIQQIKIYPNPANNKITVQTTQITEVKIFDMLGKQILSTKANEIDISSFNDGVYFIQVQTNQSTTTQKIIVQH